MKLVTIDGREVAGRPGVLLDTGDILDLTAAPATLAESQWIPQSVVSILAAGDDGRGHAGRLVQSAEQATGADELRLREAGVLLRSGETALMAPVRRPGLVLVTTPAASVDEPDPVAFIKGPNTVIGSATAVQPPWAQIPQLTGLGMPAVVFGKSLYRAEAKEAEAAVAAYTLIIDLSMPQPAPNALRAAESWRRYIDSKQFLGACPMGPAVVTVDELPSLDKTGTTTRINGVATSQGSLWSSDTRPAELLAALSRRIGFRPGDVVAFTPEVSGTEAAEQTLRPGDEMSVSVDGIMNLTVKIAG